MNKSNKIDIGSIEPSFLAPIKLNSNSEHKDVNKNKKELYILLCVRKCRDRC